MLLKQHLVIVPSSGWEGKGGGKPRFCCLRSGIYLFGIFPITKLCIGAAFWPSALLSLSTLQLV